MATQLFLTNTVADTHLGTDTLRDGSFGSGAASAWTSRALSTSRGSGVTASFATPTVTVATDPVQPVMASSAVYLEWISPPVAVDVTISGTVTTNLWVSESNMSANVEPCVLFEVIRANATATRNSNTLASASLSSSAGEAAVTTRAVQNTTYSGYGAKTLNRGDRLRIMVCGAGGSTASGFTWNLGYNGASAAADGDSYVTFSETFSFESAPGSNALSQEVNGANNVAVGGTTNTFRVGQGFRLASAETISHVELFMGVTQGTPTDDITVEIRTDSASKPTTTVLASGTLASGSLTATAWNVFALTTPVALAATTTYWIVAYRSGAVDTVNRRFWQGANADVLASVEGLSSADDSSWSLSIASDDQMFRLRRGVTTLYLTDTASAVSTASQDLEAWTSRGSGVVTSVTNTAAGWTAPLQATTTAGGTVIDWFTRPLAAFTLTGMAVANIRALESNASANASLRCEIAKVSSTGTSPTVWASWCCAPTGSDNGELTTSEVARTINLSGDDLAFSDGERIRIRLYNDDISSAAMGASQTVTRYYSGTSGGASGDSYITLPQTVTEYVTAAQSLLLPNRNQVIIRR